MSWHPKGRFLITIDGYKTLEEKLKNLEKVERPAIIIAIAEAKSYGDLSENAEYQAAKEKQRMTEREISELREILAKAEKIDISDLTGKQTVKFGSKVKILDMQSNEEKILQIVSFFEADLEKGLISAESPMGLAMLEKKTGDIFEVKTPKGIKKYKVLQVNF